VHREPFRAAWIGSALLVGAFALGCASPASPRPDSTALRHSGTQALRHSGTPLPVPFIAQQPNYCGPAALAMLANYYGHAVSQEDIAHAIYLPSVRGALTAELAGYARRFGLWTRSYRGTETDLRRQIAAGVPPLVLGRFGRAWHYFVVLGFDDARQVVFVHSDRRRQLALRRDDFLRRWDRADRWSLLVCPSERATWNLSADEHNDLGVFLERAGQPAAAAAHYRAAIALWPGRALYHLNLGNALLAQQDSAGAVTALQEAVRLEPDNADALNNLAWADHEQGEDLDEAGRLCERAIELRPSHRAYYLDTLGSIRLKQGRPRDAVIAFEAALAATTDRQKPLRAAIQRRLAEARAARQVLPAVELLRLDRQDACPTGQETGRPH